MDRESRDSRKWNEPRETVPNVSLGEKKSQVNQGPLRESRLPGRHLFTTDSFVLFTPSGGAGLCPE